MRSACNKLHSVLNKYWHKKVEFHKYTAEYSEVWIGICISDSNYKLQKTGSKQQQKSKKTYFVPFYEYKEVPRELGNDLSSKSQLYKAGLEILRLPTFLLSQRQGRKREQEGTNQRFRPVGGK